MQIGALNRHSGDGSSAQRRPFFLGTRISKYSVEQICLVRVWRILLQSEKVLKSRQWAMNVNWAQRRNLGRYFSAALILRTDGMSCDKE